MNIPIPDNEVERLQALQRYNILDTLCEQSFDDLVELACQICEAPMASITLIDADRQWFKSRIGIPFAETPREISFCTHTIMSPANNMVIEDLSCDARFTSNPFVASWPHIRFYAGAPLVTPSGHALGSICVLDYSPRVLPEKAIDALSRLSRQVVAQMELRRAVADLERSTMQQLAYQEQLEALSVTDALTGIRNRRAMDRHLADEAERSARTGSPLSFLLMDVDSFKLFNDTYGHVAGDSTLQQVAGLIQSNARPYDVVARYGGEEFAVILPQTDAAAALGIAERIRQEVQSATWPYRHVTISIGAATSDGDKKSEVLIREADAALYRAKHEGRNRVVHANSATPNV